MLMTIDRILDTDFTVNEFYKLHLYKQDETSDSNGIDDGILICLDGSFLEGEEIVGIKSKPAALNPPNCSTFDIMRIMFENLRIDTDDVANADPLLQHTLTQLQRLTITMKN